ncbi:MAG: DUF5018-related domain-containing protein [Bacteroidales bacterium]
MKKCLIYSLFFILFTMNSCLTAGLDDLPEFDGADITGVQKVEYRFISDQISPSDGKPVVKFVDFPRSTSIDKVKCIVSVSVTVPTANPSSFPQQERDKCSTSELAIMVSISTAARVFPVGNAPAFGKPGDWSQPNKYIVHAADGTKKEWTVQIVSFKK